MTDDITHVVFRHSPVDRQTVDSGYSLPFANWSSRHESDPDEPMPVCVGSKRKCEEYIAAANRNADQADPGPFGRRPRLELRVLPHPIRYSDTKPVRST